MMKAEVKGVRRGRLTFDGYDYTGECLYGIKPQKVFVRYSLSDRSKIYVFDTQERFLGVVTPVEATAPRDHEAARRIMSERRRLLRQTKALGNLAKSASPETIDLVLKREPALIDFIEKEESKKYPQKISPFLSDDTPQAGTEQGHAEEAPGSMDSSGPTERPIFYNDWEQFSWLLKQPFIEPKDQEWMDRLIEEVPFYKETYRQHLYSKENS